MSLLLYPLAAMAGGIGGAIAHESLHVAVAAAVGELHRVGWRGSWLTGGPVVDFRARTRWRTEAVLKAPLVAGVVVAVAVVLAGSGVTLGRVALAGVAVGLLWASPEDLSASRARVSEQSA
mgnify:CR=1 FL=1